MQGSVSVCSIRGKTLANRYCRLAMKRRIEQQQTHQHNPGICHKTDKRTDAANRHKGRHARETGRMRCVCSTEGACPGTYKAAAKRGHLCDGHKVGPLRQTIRACSLFQRQAYGKRSRTHTNQSMQDSRGSRTICVARSSLYRSKNFSDAQCPKDAPAHITERQFSKVYWLAMFCWKKPLG